MCVYNMDSMKGVVKNPDPCFNGFEKKILIHNRG